MRFDALITGLASLITCVSLVIIPVNINYQVFITLSVNRIGDFISKKILITGSSGFIGSHLVHEAIEKGYEVRGLDIREPTSSEGIEFIKGDIRNKDDVRKAIAGVDYVIHLAAVTSVVEFEKNPVECYEINVNGFLNVISASLENNIKKLIYASSAAVYTGEHFSDSLPVDYSKQHNPYSQSKIINEMIADYYYGSKGLETVGIRLFNVFGEGENEKGQYASIASQFLKNRKNSEPLIVYGDGSQARDFVYVNDVAKILVSLLEHSKHGVYNVGTGNATSYKDIAELIDAKHIQYVKNPLKTYQNLTKADISKLISIMGPYEFVNIKDWIAKQME